jgi:hypothetical protein
MALNARSRALEDAMKHAQQIALALALPFATLLVTTAGCGGPLEQGYTDCGSSVCSPGQYCFGGGVCSNGCTSDANCATGQACQDIDDVVGYGTCTESAAPAQQQQDDAPPPPPSDPIAACKAAVDSFQSCGLPAGDAAQWRSDCEQLTEDQAIVITNCGDDVCSNQPSCLGLDCFNDEHCAAGESCVGNDCL